MNVAHESLISFVKVKPFMYRGKRYTVKHLIFANMHEVNIEDYIRNLRSSLDQIFKPMNISLNKQKVTLAEKELLENLFMNFRYYTLGERFGFG